MDDDLRVHVGDCIAFVRSETARSGGPWADLVFADPPFNIGYKYDVYDDDRERGEYLSWTLSWMRACRAALRPSGTMWVAAPDEYVHRFRVILEDDLGMHLRSHVVWSYSFGVNSSKKFTRSHAHLLYYVVDRRSFTWNGDDVKEPSWRQLNGDKRAAPGGKHPDDTWRFNRICGTHKERTGHPCQMPVAILDRIVRVSSDPGDVVMDPFMGSGTTGVAATGLGRRFVGCELSADYADKAIKRIERELRDAMNNETARSLAADPLRDEKEAARG